MSYFSTSLSDGTNTFQISYEGRENTFSIKLKTKFFSHRFFFNLIFYSNHKLCTKNSFIFTFKLFVLLLIPLGLPIDRLTAKNLQQHVGIDTLRGDGPFTSEILSQILHDI
jgi:hypothetical protein